MVIAWFYYGTLAKYLRTINIILFWSTINVGLGQVKANFQGNETLVSDLTSTSTSIFFS